MALRAARQKQRRAQQIPVRSGEGDVVDENVVQRSLCHRDFPLKPSRAPPADANSAFAARAYTVRSCAIRQKSNWQSAITLCITRPFAASLPATPRLRRAFGCWSAEALAKAESSGFCSGVNVMSE